MTRFDGEHPFDAGTRVAAGDDGTTYDRFAITLHWLTALLVLAQFVLSQTWGWFPRPTRHLMIVSHMSQGILLAAVIVVRVIWRLVPGHQVSSLVVGWIDVASKAAHYLLYALLAAEAALGFTLRWSGGEAMSFFGLPIAPPFAPFGRPLQHQIGEWHEEVGWAIVIVALGHAVAALYHHYRLHDRVLVRMAPIFARR